MSGAELALTQGGKRPEAGKLEAEIESLYGPSLLLLLGSKHLLSFSELLRRVWVLALSCLWDARPRNEIVRGWIHLPKAPS